MTREQEGPGRPRQQVQEARGGDVQAAGRSGTRTSASSACLLPRWVVARGLCSAAPLGILLGCSLPSPMAPGLNVVNDDSWRPPGKACPQGVTEVSLAGLRGGVCGA